MLKKILLPLCLLFFISGCGSGEQSLKTDASNDVTKYSSQVFSMDTVMDISVYARDDSILEDAGQLVEHLNGLLSTTDENSEIYQLNQTGSAVLSPETSALLNRAMDLCSATNGTLDLSIYPVVRAWGFTTDAYRIPSLDELEGLLKHVDYTKIEFSPENRQVSLPDGMEIDLGSVAKGYTGDLLLQLFKDHEISSALLNLGGNVQALGSKPDGSDWKVGIQDPLGDGYLGVLSISDQSVITSGGYERFFQGDDGTIYWHIIDPETGFPARNGIISATAVGKEGVYCDALSTSLFIMGREKAEEFWREHGDFDMILVTDQGEVIITPGLESSFQLSEDSSYELVVAADD